MRFWAVWGVLLLGAITLTALVSTEETLSLEADVIAAVQESPFPGNTLSNLIRAVTHTEHDVVVGIILGLVL